MLNTEPYDPAFHSQVYTKRNENLYPYKNLLENVHSSFIDKTKKVGTIN
jgi:hypothetical protein